MNQFLFGTFPYIALAIGILGSIARYERDPFTLAIPSLVAGLTVPAPAVVILGSVLFPCRRSA